MYNTASHPKIWTVPKHSGIMLLTHVVVNTRVQEKALDFSLFPAGPAQAAGSEQRVGVPQRLLSAHPACGCLCAVYQSATAR